MTNTNIYAMDAIVNELANGKTISDALKTVFTKRKVRIPHNAKTFDVPVESLHMSRRTTNVLMRNKMYTLGHVVKYCENESIRSFRGAGKEVVVETMETILNYAWDHMTEAERVEFFIDTVNLNEEYMVD
jgi:DNA-directed RNA polymerase alpha subunit